MRNIDGMIGQVQADERMEGIRVQWFFRSAERPRQDAVSRERSARAVIGEVYSSIGRAEVPYILLFSTSARFHLSGDRTGQDCLKSRYMVRVGDIFALRRRVPDLNRADTLGLAGAYTSMVPHFCVRLAH